MKLSDTIGLVLKGKDPLRERTPAGRLLMKQTFAIGIGGAAGQGVATPGDME